MWTLPAKYHVSVILLHRQLLASSRPVQNIVIIMGYHSTEELLQFPSGISLQF